MRDPGALDLEFLADDALAGFRLRRLEVFNWGTFHGRVWSLALEGRTALLTGDIGSGKSTLVDALTTLLVPPQRVAYNKAAGADARERNLRSYVRGDYKSERSEETGTTRTVSLRGEHDYSVILAVFHNAGFDQTVTLAQVFWTSEGQSSPKRLYVVGERELSIAGEFTQFGSEIGQLRKRLRALGIETPDSFTKYAGFFRRKLGIATDQALELFHQTVSLKSIGNLTDFVRSHMLQPFDVESRIQALIAHFDDLDRAHEAVRKARQQVELLTPLVADCQRHAALQVEVTQQRRGRDALGGYIARSKTTLLDARLERLRSEGARLQAQVEQATVRRDQLRVHAGEIRDAIAASGGDRIARLTAEIAERERTRSQRQQKAQRYALLCSVVEEQAADTVEAFVVQRSRLDALRERALERDTELLNAGTELGVEMRQGKIEHDELRAEIDSLKRRRSNIDDQQVRIRARLCEALRMDEEEMPFAGELLQVRESERDWEGAAERILRGFGLSLLVPESHYRRVAAWVDQNHLRGRLVYFQVRERTREATRTLHPRSLVRKISIKRDSPHYTWLERELLHRFDLACCDDADEFAREPRALMRSGQMKEPGGRHEKDDRHRIDDRSRFVLGWTNTEKIAAFEEKAARLLAQLGNVAARLAAVDTERKSLREQVEALTRLAEFAHFDELDWGAAAAEVQRLTEERRRLEAASDKLAQLTTQLQEVSAELEAIEKRLDESKDERSRVEQRRQDAEQQREAAAQRAEEHRDLLDADVEAGLDALRNKVAAGRDLRVEGCERLEQEMREEAQRQIDTIDLRLGRLGEKIVQAMHRFRQSFPVETAEFDASVEAAQEYAELLGRLQRDDLPRFEMRFKELLNVNTINEIANFSAQLTRERETIRDRIRKINESLTRIDYDRGRYIVLLLQPTPDAEIRDFQSELRACTEGTLTGSDDAQYSERKFTQVKSIVDRFRGREGQTELDSRWTQRVTDVRNWFLFSASERWREDDREKEHYSDSGGKSGGQKEKLAYTVLAASLAYQFGLEWGEVRSRSFRFVVIDEAFGRGSDESAQYALRLFELLKLQLLIVTPLQKIHVIEPFVSAVGYVHNETGSASQLRTLTIEEYRQEKAKAAG